jgi:nicotinamidase-related amidase
MSNSSALLIVDVIHPFEFEGADALLKHARTIVPALLRTRSAFDRAGRPVIYCNDNFGKWRSEARSIIDYCTDSDREGSEFVQAILPRESDYFVLKPKHSAFLLTPLELLLDQLSVKRLYLAGLAGEACVADTATDANAREYDVIVVADATASESKRRNARAMTYLTERCVARVIQSTSVSRSLRR